MRKVRNQSAAGLSRARELRRNMTESEKKLWELLRNRRHEYKFRKQHAIDRYFLDFYCAEARLCVELDGDSHTGREDYDAARDSFLAALSIETLRISTADLYEFPDGVIEKIWLMCERRVGVSE